MLEAMSEICIAYGRRARRRQNTAKIVSMDGNNIDAFSMEAKTIPHSAYSSYFALDDYPLFLAFGHTLEEKDVSDSENVKKFLGDYFTSKSNSFPKDRFPTLPFM